MPREELRNIAAMAKGTRCSKKAEIRIHHKGEPGQSKTIRVGFQRVPFTLREDVNLTLVVVRGMGEKPLMLLTHLEIETAEDALKIMRSTLPAGSVRNPSDSLKRTTS